MLAMAQPAFCGRLGSSSSSFTFFVGSQQKQAYVRYGFRLTSICCRHKQPSTEGVDSSSLIERKSSRQRSRKHQLKRHSLASYKRRFALALQAELNAEQQEIKERLRNWPKQKLASEGVALFDLCVRHEGSLYRDRVVSFYPMFGDGLLPVHNQFGQGDIVAISRKHPLAEEEGALEGVVLERARRYIKVAIPFSQSRDLDLQRSWRLDLYANSVAYERCLFAVDIFSSPLVQQHGAVFHLETTEKMSKSSVGWLLERVVKFGEGASALRGLIMKNQEINLLPSPSQEENSSSEEENSTIFSVSRDSEALEELKVLKSPPSQISGKKLGDAKGSIRGYLQRLGEQLNSSQRAAVEMAALQRVTLWQGPPGTGKTKTLTHLIAALCERGERILACADRVLLLVRMLDYVRGLI